MVTHFISKVEYADVDSSLKVRLSDLLNYLLKASDDSVEKSGISTRYLRNKYNSAWVLLKMSIIMSELPSYYDYIEIETWEVKTFHNVVRRDYQIYLCRPGIERSQIGKGTSSWTILNLKTREIETKVFQDDLWKKDEDSPSINISREIFLSQEYDDYVTYRVKYSDLDFNNHLNSCKYLQYFLDTNDNLSKVVPIRFDIVYRKEIRKGEKIRIGTVSKENRTNYVLYDEDGNVSCQAIIQKQ